MINTDIQALFAASHEMAALRKENRELRQELQRLRAPRVDFDLSADSAPELLKRQAG
ncbi:MAG: hypothetical protein M3O26_15730 [Pseudomonadota bacterium]|nr:hypothetical protein [Pseudomonadota bacterium]